MVKVIEPGHIYMLDWLDTQPMKGSDDLRRLTFVNREEGSKHGGAQNQDVLRAVIDRVKYLERQLPHEVNKAIIFHLRMALVLHESRALERRVMKGGFEPESIGIGPDGHFLLTHLDTQRGP